MADEDASPGDRSPSVVEAAICLINVRDPYVTLKDTLIKQMAASEQRRFRAIPQFLSNNSSDWSP